MTNLQFPKFPETVAELLKLLRENLSLSQGDLAQELEVSQNTVSLFERGINEPDRLTTTRWHTSESPIANWLSNEIFIVRARQALNLNRIGAQAKQGL